MSAKRIVPNLLSDNPQQSHDFYEEFLGLEVVMERDEIVTFALPDNSTAQISVVRPNEGSTPNPNISIEVADVDVVYSKAVTKGMEIVYPITNEPWGVRRFFVLDPSGAIINILSHR